MLSIFAFKKEDSAATIVCTKAEIQTWQKGCRLHSGPLGSAGTPAGTERGSWWCSRWGPGVPAIPSGRKRGSPVASISKLQFLPTAGSKSQFFQPLPGSVLFFEFRECLLQRFSVGQLLDFWKGSPASCSAKNLHGAKSCSPSPAKRFPRARGSQLSPVKWKTNETEALVDLLHEFIPLSPTEGKNGKIPLKPPAPGIVFSAPGENQAGLRDVNICWIQDSFGHQNSSKEANKIRIH